jgi:opacity protein-like surface antigen
VWIQRILPGGDVVRLGAGVSASSAEGTAYHDIDEDSVDISVSADYVHYRSRDGEMSLMLGAGPTVGIGSLSSFESGQTDEDTAVVYREWRTEEDRWSVGVEVLLGAEWQLTRHIAVSGEYSSSLVYSIEHGARRCLEASRRGRAVGDGG